MGRDIVVVSGYLVRCPLGGYAWQNLHYLLGLEALGFESFFYEDTAFHSECFEPRSGNVTDDPASGLELASRFFAAHGLSNRWVFDDTWRGRTFGLEPPSRDALLRDARAWITLAAVNRLPASWRGRRATAFVDIDPGYTQLNAAAEDVALLGLLREHYVHFSTGELIGTPSCPVPTGGFSWRPTRQPVVPSLWKTAPLNQDAPFTTIGRWDERRREVVVNGERYSWRKRSEWMKFLDLPARTGERFCLAMDVAKMPDDLARLERHGWEVVDPVATSADPDVYRNFIRSSKGEFTVAKDLNVRLKTGWFSDRAACYLAAGRPVVNQETGFDQLFPARSGLFGFLTVDEAAAAIDDIRKDYAANCAAARRLCESLFAPERVLPPLLEHVL